MDLHTARLLLRPFRASDHADLHAILGHPEMVRRLDSGTGSPEDTAVFLGCALAMETEEPRRAWKFAVVRSAGGELIGSAELHVDCTGSPRPATRTTPARPGCWRRPV